MNLLEWKFIKLFIRKEFISVIEIISFTTFPEIFHQVPDKHYIWRGTVFSEVRLF